MDNDDDGDNQMVERVIDDNNSPSKSMSVETGLRRRKENRQNRYGRSGSVDRITREQQSCKHAHRGNVQLRKKERQQKRYSDTYQHATIHHVSSQHLLKPPELLQLKESSRSRSRSMSPSYGYNHNHNDNNHNHNRYNNRNLLPSPSPSEYHQDHKPTIKEDKKNIKIKPSALTSSNRQPTPTINIESLNTDNVIIPTPYKKELFKYLKNEQQQYKDTFIYDLWYAFSEGTGILGEQYKYEWNDFSKWKNFDSFVLSKWPKKVWSS